MAAIEAVEINGRVIPLKRHFHSYYVIGLVLQGRRTLFTNGKQYPVAAGDMMLLNPCQVHACVSESSEPFLYRAFHVQREEMEALTGPFYRYEEPIWHGSMMDAAFLAAYENAGLRAAFIQRVSQARMRSAPPAETDARFDEACAYLRAHFRRGVTVAELCEVCHCSRSHLLHSFTRELGIPPGAYQEALRVECAQEGLRRGLRPMEAGIEAGFCDQSYFTRFFKRFTGLTPGYYQRMIGDIHA